MQKESPSDTSNFLMNKKETHLVCVSFFPFYGGGWKLLDRHRFGQVARLVDLTAAQAGDVIREQL